MSLKLKDVFEPTEVNFQAALVYLTMPVVIFLLSFVKLLVGALITLLVISALVQNYFLNAPGKSVRLPIVAPIMGSLAIMGITGFFTGFYNWDWIKHWALVNELATQPWPLVIDLQGITSHLRFYVGAYLVPSLAHKLLPILPIPLALFAWFGIGYVLVFQTVSAIIVDNKRAWMSIILVLMFGGADFYIEHLSRFLSGLPSAPYFGLHYESWFYNATGIPLEYSSIITALVWVPHQSIATFLVASMLVFQRQPQTLPVSILGFGLLSIWSPYGMIGLFPLITVIAWHQRVGFLRNGSWVPIAAGIAVSITMVSYLSTEMPSAGTCFSCLLERLTSLHYFVVFWAVELTTFVLILRASLLKDMSCLVSFITLLALPLMYGQTGDFVMRGSMGPLFILALRSTQTILEWRVSLRQKTLQICALCLCLPATASEVVYNASAGVIQSHFADTDPLGARWMRTFATRSDYNAKEFFDICGWHYSKQYFSKIQPRLTRNP